MKVNERTHRKGWLQEAVTVTHPRHLGVAAARVAPMSRRGHKAGPGACGSRAWLRPTAAGCEDAESRPSRVVPPPRAHASRAHTAEQPANLTPPNSPGISRATVGAPRLLREAGPTSNALIGWSACLVSQSARVFMPPAVWALIKMQQKQEESVVTALATMYTIQNKILSLTFHWYTLIIQIIKCSEEQY